MPSREHLTNLFCIAPSQCEKERKYLNMKIVEFSYFLDYFNKDFNSAMYEKAELMIWK